jgi:dTDP-4-dehydrorhamnose 3,5-epimerase
LADQRGYFERVFCAAELQGIVADRKIVQINHSLTIREGAVRGMHFQRPPHAEVKLVSCIRGAVYDVAVDLRHDSATFLRWHAEILSPENHRTLCIPEGFAHGFQTLTADCEMLYLHTAAYARKSESGLHPCDPRLAIAWPKAIVELSPRDAALPMVSADLDDIKLRSAFAACLIDRGNG